MPEGPIGRTLLSLSRFIVAVVVRAGKNGVQRDGGELFVGSRLFVQRLLEQLRDLGVAEVLGEGPGGAVGGNLVVLDALGGANEGGVNDGDGAVRFENLL